MSATNGSQGVLSGVRVLDLTQFEAGPSCTEALAWLGAEVVKVENPKGGDQGRMAMADVKDKDSWYFLIFNANKKSITCDLKTEQGVQLVKDLAAQADVFVENFGPGVVDKFGLGYDAINALNERIIYAQVKGFGEGSPYENNLSFDMIAQSVGGLLSITGEPDGKPCKPGTTLGDTGTGMLLAVSILGALLQQRQTGKGQLIQLAMQDAMMQYIRLAFAAQQTYGKPAHRAGAATFTTGNAPNGIFPCKPGGPNDYVYIFTSRAGNRHWHRLLKAIGSENLIGDERYESPDARAEREDEVNALLTAWTMQHDKREAMAIIGDAGVPAGAVLDTAELRDDPDLTARGIFQTMTHPTRGDYKMPVWPVKMSGSAVPLQPSPLLGEHVDDVLTNWLDMTPEAVQALKADGVV